jgi:membrane protease YdiL (CAAX protease family)
MSFYLLTLTLSWGYWLTLLAKGLRVAPDSIAHFPGLLGPMLAAIAVTAVIGGRKALRELFARMVWLGPRWISKLMLALSPLVLGAVALTILPLLGKPLPAVGAFAQVPGMPDGWPLAWVLAAVIVVNGFGEETGWRGFLTERLLRTQGRARTALWVGLLWALWHLPLFWLNTGMTALVGPALIGWVFALICGSFVLAQVYLATGHSILCAALWHVSFNMMVSAQLGSELPAAIVGTAVVVWGVVVAVRWWRAVADAPGPDRLLSQRSGVVAPDRP